MEKGGNKLISTTGVHWYPPPFGQCYIRLRYAKGACGNDIEV